MTAIPCIMAEAVVTEATILGSLSSYEKRCRRGRDARPAMDFTEFSDDPESGEDPYLCLYRGQTLGLLRRFFRTSMETGRLPTLLGREFFRSKIASWQAATFEDAVIFVHDVERSLEKLDRHEQELIAKIVFQEHTQAEAARLLHSTPRTVARNYADAIDHLSKIFLAGELLEPLGVAKAEAKNSCQEAKRQESFVSHCTKEENIF